MASVTITFTAGSNTGSSLRKLAAAIDAVAAPVPDVVSSGASTVLTIDNAVGPVAGVQITAGPYAGAQILVG